jgi:uncharacterized protein YdeI (BOF family)
MKKMILAVAAILILAVAPVFAASEHGGHGDHNSAAHEEVVEGVKATFTVQTMKEAMKAMGMELPKGVKETHHISVGFKDVKSGKALTEGDVKVKVQGPDKKEQTKDMLGMQGHFGADFELAKKGKYGVMAKFQLKDGKVRSAKFWYTVK